MSLPGAAQRTRPTPSLVSVTFVGPAVTSPRITPTTARPHRRDTERPAERRSAHSAHPKSRFGYACGASSDFACCGPTEIDRSRTNPTLNTEHFREMLVWRVQVLISTVKGGLHWAANGICAGIRP
eukprot:COSAG05_NODE_135_length_16947_cov_294.166548_6_plen_126_part_00